MKAVTRKLIKTGNSLSLTLPRDFVLKAGLKSKAEVGVIYDDMLVIINPNVLEIDKIREILDDRARESG